ncbi:hypothetical protein F9278_37110 [Streptomyces phaeolivaceus]|uniref:Uncharacterized protein n=1 Tax=Streptomyces phaeolivaceus TaxID=2653200 RepID=A0A5P8KDJ9_9ACTN|nr:hypothetical protein F9278_37110 [Streptomyces phaeolivaceus]
MAVRSGGCVLVRRPVGFRSASGSRPEPVRSCPGPVREVRSYELPVTPVSHDLIMERYARHTRRRKGL